MSTEPNEFYVHHAVIKQYMGLMALDERSPYFVRLNAPDEIGPIAWKLIDTAVYCSIQNCREVFTGTVFAEPPVPGSDEPTLPKGVFRGGPAVGRLRSGEGNVYYTKFRIRGMPHTQVGFIIEADVSAEGELPIKWEYILRDTLDTHDSPTVGQNKKPNT